VYQELVGEFALAKKTYEDFLKRYRVHRGNAKRKKRWRNWRCCRTADAPLGDEQRGGGKFNRAVLYGGSARECAGDSGGKSVADRDRGRSASARIRRVPTRCDRVTIDLEDNVQYIRGGIANPSASFSIARGAADAGSRSRELYALRRLLTAVRVAQNHDGVVRVVRVVLDVNGVKDYTASLTQTIRRALDRFVRKFFGAPVHTAEGNTRSTGAKVIRMTAQQRRTANADGFRNAAARNRRGTRPLLQSSRRKLRRRHQWPGWGAIGGAIGTR